ncbi:hypothetical protein G6O69_19215 [Pseudenhygromyxa sp. WMMC2535]|uniref:hypothetical protein n=1 Tax=Pseudenhygromyxa sp. WMMC2535 TaxID=2712867 RepID=UPI001551911A|nr:hypothetical protein [Pseudenhygromyxa sp. WMMC2535]NVB39983.1 hypothetical protein [Pseudenhygromyxa sp. WMMC2535]
MSACIPGGDDDATGGSGSESEEETTSTGSESESTTDTSTESESTESTESESTESTGTESTGTESTDTESTESTDTTDGDTTDGDTTESETAETDTTETDTDTGGNLDCLPADAFEDNDVAEEAFAVEWNDWNGFELYASLEASLCEEEDWYFLDVSSTDFESDPEDRAFYVDIIVEGSSWCGVWCEQPELPVAVENTVSVEVYDAESMQLLVAQTAENGRVNVDKTGAAYDNDLLVRVYGPAVVNYNYKLTLSVREQDGEDECEC